jgi:hypothetical protein
MSEWVKKIWYIHAMEFYSAIEKNEIMPFFGNDGTGGHHVK